MSLTKVISQMLDLRFSTNQDVSNTVAGVNAGQNINTAPSSGQNCQFNTAFGYQALKANDLGYGSTAIGYNALLTANTVDAGASTAIGAHALELTTTGGGNTAIGHDACYKNTTGDLNVAIGKGALYSNDTGSYNVAIGLDCLGTGLYPAAGKAGDNNVAIGFNSITLVQNSNQNVSIGNAAGANLATATNSVAIGADAMQGNAASPTTNNVTNSVAVGFRALYQAANASNNNVAIGAYSNYFNSNGVENVAIGTSALYGAQAGIAPFSNTAIGSNAMFNITSGDSNVAVGQNALYQARNGEGNVAIGYASLSTTSNGSNYNSALGYGAGQTVSGGSNNTCLGSNAGTATAPFNITTQSNRVVVGDSNVTNAYIQVAWSVISDERDKANIEDGNYGLDFISKLRTVKFKRDNRNRYENGVSDGSKKDQKYTFGFLAQNVIEAEKSCGATDETLLIADNEDANNLKVVETSVIPALVKALQELKAEFDAYKSTHP